jgi:hypothetical protein
MKFYIPNDRIAQVNEDDCIWLNPAEFVSHRKAIILYEWANGWIFEADDSFNTYFKLITGKQLPTITDAEYAQYIVDKIAFLGKERCQQFRTAWTEFQPKINTR